MASLVHGPEGAGPGFEHPGGYRPIAAHGVAVAAEGDPLTHGLKIQVDIHQRDPILPNS